MTHLTCKSYWLWPRKCDGVLEHESIFSMLNIFIVKEETARHHITRLTDNHVSRPLFQPDLRSKLMAFNLSILTRKYVDFTHCLVTKPKDQCPQKLPKKSWVLAQDQLPATLENYWKTLKCILIAVSLLSLIWIRKRRAIKTVEVSRNHVFQWYGYTQ